MCLSTTRSLGTRRGITLFSFLLFISMYLNCASGAAPHYGEGGQGHPERFLPKAEASCLSESIQRLYEQNNSNTNWSFHEPEEHFIKIARGGSAHDEGLPGNLCVTDDRVVKRIRWRDGSRYYNTLLYTQC
jgi:hypothetical protein